MALDLSSCSFVGPALPEPFVKFDLEAELSRNQLLAPTSGEQGRRLQDSWNAYRRGLRELVSRGGSIRVRNQVIEPLVRLLGYEELSPAESVETREGQEAGGVLLISTDGEKPLRVWTTDFETDLDAPARRGYAYRYSHVRVAQRVLLAVGERVGLLTNGVQLRILISDPARPDSQVIIPVDPDWKRSREVPDSFRLLLALCSPKGLATVPELVDKARLKQARVTKELRTQAQQAIERFVQEVLDNPNNQQWLELHADRAKLAKDLWPEGLKIVYRLLFILKGEVSDDPARAFGFASTSLWRNTYSPSVALAPYARKVLDEGAATGGFLEHGLRTLFRLFEEGIECTELHIAPLGGALFGANTTPIVSGLEWGERAVAHLLDRLLWTPRRRGSSARERVHYGALDVEDLGRVYEALLELEPGIAAEPMCRLRRQKLEVVVPIAQGEKYRSPTQRAADSEDENETEEEPEEDEAEDEAPRKKTKVEWVEAIHPGQFYLRVGLGRKTSGSFYTPHSFVRFLVQETLGPQVAERSPQNDPNPGAILKLKVLDPAMGSGHFLVAACRFLGEKLYEACRACDEKALEAERRAEAAAAKDDEAAFAAADEETQHWRQRLIDLPDPEDELLRYLPSRAPEGEESGLSQRKAEALSRRLVAVHCLYGVDKNPLAIELAKLSLWLESQAEGLPLTFLDHRLVLGDSLTGPFWDKLIFRPGKQEPIQDLFHQNLDKKFVGALREAIKYVDLLDASVGTTLADLENKRRLKADLDHALAPFKVIAAAWSGGVMAGPDKCDDLAYSQLVKAVGDTGDLPEDLSTSQRLRAMIAKGLGVETVPAKRDELYELIASGACVPTLPYDLTFPEVFFPNAEPFGRRGFSAVLGNPPWDKLKNEKKAFVGSFHFPILEIDRKSAWEPIANRFLQDNAAAAEAWSRSTQSNAGTKAVGSILYTSQSYQIGGVAASGDRDQFMYFLERGLSLLSNGSRLGMVLSGGLAKNPAATVSRRMSFIENQLVAFLHYHNRHLLFADLPGILEFTLIVTQRGSWAAPGSARIGVDLDSFEDLEGDAPKPRFRELSRQELVELGGDLLILTATSLTSTVIERGHSLADLLTDLRCGLGRDLDRTEDEVAYRSVAALLEGTEDARDPRVWLRLLHLGCVPLRGSRSISHFTDSPAQRHARWSPRATLCVDLSASRVRSVAWRAAYFRLALRRHCGSPKTNERSLVACLLPAPSLGADQLLIEPTPSARPTAGALLATTILNSFTADHLVRPKVQAMMSKSILEGTAAPILASAAARSLLAHTALRLSCNHEGYTPLWKEQLGDAWREPGKQPFTWPVLATDKERWQVRSAIDAVVADAYGLSRGQYEHVLKSFDRASGPNPYTGICLEKFDELKAIGLDAFTKKHDPYWDIPLVETLPKPVIDLPIPSEKAGSKQQAAMVLDLESGAKSRRRTE